MSENLYGEDKRFDMSRLQKMLSNMSCGTPRSGPITMLDFNVHQKLGTGAYGKVFRARNTRDGKDYALKQIQVPSDKEGIPQSVLREITVMKRISRQNNPHVIGLCHIFHHIDKDTHMVKIDMVMEKCDWDLHTFIYNVNKSIPEKQARHLASQIVKGLDFLHSNLIIHRDLKPQNILVNRDQTVKIADFGLSKEFSNTSAFTVCVVTLWYRSPEVLLQSFYNSTVDMWAFGCILYEIYTQTALFAGANEARQLNAIFKKMGTPTGTDWPEESVLTKDSFPNYAGGFLDHKTYTEGMSAMAIDFLKKCLRYHPAKRLSSRHALQHEYIKEAPLPVKPRVLRRLNFSGL